MSDRTWVDTARRLCLGVLAMLIGMELVTGILLGLLYEPSRMPATTPDGRVATVITGERIERVGPFTDTVGHPSLPSLVAAQPNDGIPSAAATSVNVQIAVSPGGVFIRSIHHTLAGWLVVLALVVVLLGVFERIYRNTLRDWTMMVMLVVIVLGAAWTGRILPDDVYAEVSLRIVGQELLDAPLGDALVALLGISPGAPHIARTFFMHLILGAASVWLAWVLWRERQQLPFVLGIALSAAGISAMLPMHAFGFRDAVTGLAGTVDVDPWWVIWPLHQLVGALGAELAGYMVVGGTLAVLLLPAIRRR